MIKFLIHLIDSIVWPLLLVILIWLAFLFNFNYDLGLHEYGLQPWKFKGLAGIFAMPFLHGDSEHLVGNSVPLVLSLGFVFLYFKDVRWKVFFITWFVSGVLLWFLGEYGSNHIGASGLVYGYIAFMITHAIITRNKETMAASFVLIFLYGSLVYGIFPDYGRIIGKNISWEGHLSGAIVGVALAFLYRKKGPQKQLYFTDEDDDDEDLDQDDFYEKPSDVTINYHYQQDKLDSD